MLLRSSALRASACLAGLLLCACTQSPSPVPVTDVADHEPPEPDGPPYPETTESAGPDVVAIRVERVSLRHAATLAAQRAQLVIDNPEALPDRPISLKFDRIHVAAVMSLIAGEAQMNWVRMEDRIRFEPRPSHAARQGKPGA